MKSCVCILIIVVAIIIILIGWNYMNNRKSDKLSENFNDQVGKFCTTCDGKNPNQCMNCFNCGFCVDKYGNSQCIGGDYKGPYNHEKCAYWYQGDPFTFMMQKNADYKCSDGPRSCNRLIGI